MSDVKNISYTQSLVKPQEKPADHGYAEKIDYLSGTLEVEADGDLVTVYNQGAYQSLYKISATGVHHSKMNFPGVQVETATANAEITFYPFSIEVCDLVSRVRMKTGEKGAFHYHNGRTVRLVLSGSIQMVWIQNNSKHSVILEENDWIVIPANVPYQSIVLKEVDLLANYVCGDGTTKFDPQLNTIGKYKIKG